MSIGMPARRAANVASAHLNEEREHYFCHLRVSRTWVSCVCWFGAFCVVLCCSSILPCFDRFLYIHFFATCFSGSMRDATGVAVRAFLVPALGDKNPPQHRPPAEAAFLFAPRAQPALRPPERGGAGCQLISPCQVAPSTVRPLALARDPRVLIGWPFPLGFGLDGRLLLARRGRVYV